MAVKWNQPGGGGGLVARPAAASCTLPASQSRRRSTSLTGVKGSHWMPCMNCGQGGGERSVRARDSRVARCW